MCGSKTLTIFFFSVCVLVFFLLFLFSLWGLECALEREREKERDEMEEVEGRWVIKSW